MTEDMIFSHDDSNKSIKILQKKISIFAYHYIHSQTSNHSIINNKNHNKMKNAHDLFYKTICLYSIAILIPGIWLITTDFTLESFIKLTFSIIFIIIWHASFENIQKAIYFSICFFILLPLDIFYFYFYQEPPTTPVLIAISESNLDEAMDFMQGRKIELISTILFSFLVWLSTVKNLSNEIPSNFLLISKKIRVISRILLTLCLITIFIFVGTPYIEGLAIKQKTLIPISKGLIFIDRNLSPFFIRLKGTFPLGRMISIGEYYRENFNFQNSNRRKENFLFNAKQTELINENQIFLLIIGETARGDHMQLNGYHRETSPRLKENKNVIPLLDIVTPWTFTNRAVSTLISRKKISNNEDLIDEKSIIGAFQEAGFKTYWISNQQPIGIGETRITHFAHEADESIFLNASAKVMLKSGNYDARVLLPLNKILDKNEKKQFIIIHLLGSHDSYDKRYPSEFDLFKPSLANLVNPDHHNSNYKTEVINSFDNSMLYTDFILSEIVSFVNAKNSISSLVYSSDHGEMLFDGNCKRSGHGGSGKQEYPVASLIWISDQYISRWPDEINLLKLNSKEKITTEYIFPTTLDLAKISFNLLDKSRSLSSKEFRVHQRLVNASVLVNWDTAVTKGDCNSLVEK